MLLRVIQSEADAAGRVDWSVSVDSSIVRAHQHSATAKREDRAGSGEHTGGQGRMTRILDAVGTSLAITPWAAPAAG